MVLRCNSDHIALLLKAYRALQESILISLPLAAFVFLASFVFPSSLRDFAHAVPVAWNILLPPLQAELPPSHLSSLCWNTTSASCLTSTQCVLTPYPALFLFTVLVSLYNPMFMYHFPPAHEGSILVTAASPKPCSIRAQ